MGRWVTNLRGRWLVGNSFIDFLVGVARKSDEVFSVLVISITRDFGDDGKSDLFSRCQLDVVRRISQQVSFLPSAPGNYTNGGSDE